MIKYNLSRIKSSVLGVIVFSFCFSSFAQINPASVCDNLDFRRGDFTGWVGKTSVYAGNHPDANNCSGGVTTVCPNGTGNSCNGCYSGTGMPVPGASAALGPIPFYFNTGIVPGRHTIMSTSTPDPYACNNIMTLPPNEPYCARLGNGGIGSWGNGVGWQVDYLSYTFIVDATNSLLTYKYAVVFQDPVRDPAQIPHTPSIRPRFVAKVTETTTGALIDPVCGILDAIYDTLIAGYRECSLSAIQSMGGNPYAAVGTAYRAWTTVGVDLRNFIGKSVTLEFNTWDCGWGGHFGYAYVSARCDAFKLQTLNCTSNGSVLVQAPDGFSYKWFPSGSTTKDILVNNPNPGDSVWVELTSVNGCKTVIGTKIFPVVIDAKFIPNPTSVCPNTPITFTDSSTSYYTADNSSIPVVTWNWNFGDGATSNVQNPVHTYQNTGIYTVKLIVSNQNGCIDSIKKVVQVVPGPIADFTFSDICLNNSGIFNDASQSPASQFISNWLWTFHNNSSTQQNSSNFYNTSGNYNVNLQVTTNNGCKNDVTKTIKIYPLPIANFSATTVCVGDTTFFTNLSLKGDPTDNVVNAVWNFGDNAAFSSSYNTAHVYLTSGTYQVRLIVVSANGCVKDTTISVTVHPKPIPNFVSNRPCLGAPVSFTDLSTPSNVINSWQWNFDDTNNNTSNLQNPTHTYNLAVVYYPKLIIASQYGCIDSIVVPVEIPPLPIVDFDADKYNGCAPLCVTFINKSYSTGDSIVKWDWDFGDGNGSFTKSPLHCYTIPGIYTVSLTIETVNSCKNTFTWNAMINVYPFPVANFDADPYETFESSPVIQFYNQSIGANDWHWTFGDNSSSDAVDTSHTYIQAGTYAVWLYVKNQYGCVDSIAKNIIINKEWTFYVPNAFTPGISNGVNDGFIGKGTNIKEYEMWIFDRWGNQIYHCDSMDEPWYGPVNNGANKETNAQIDVYVWKIKLKDLFGKTHRYIGTVTLVR